MDSYKTPDRVLSAKDVFSLRIQWRIFGWRLLASHPQAESPRCKCLFTSPPSGRYFHPLQPTCPQRPRGRSAISLRSASLLTHEGPRFPGKRTSPVRTERAAVRTPGGGHSGRQGLTLGTFYEQRRTILPCLRRCADTPLCAFTHVSVP